MLSLLFVVLIFFASSCACSPVECEEALEASLELDLAEDALLHFEVCLDNQCAAYTYSERAGTYTRRAGPLMMTYYDSRVDAPGTRRRFYFEIPLASQFSGEGALLEVTVHDPRTNALLLSERRELEIPSVNVCGEDCRRVLITLEQ